MIALEILSSIQGHNKIFIQETDPEKRAELGKKVEELLKQGFEIFLVNENDSLAHRVAGYDHELNEWIVYLSITESKPESVAQNIARPKPSPQPRRRHSAQNTRAVAVAKIAGG